MIEKKCSNCSATMKGNVCEYCGTVYKPDIQADVVNNYYIYDGNNRSVPIQPQPTPAPVPPQSPPGTIAKSILSGCCITIIVCVAVTAVIMIVVNASISEIDKSIGSPQSKPGSSAGNNPGLAEEEPAVAEEEPAVAEEEFFVVDVAEMNTPYPVRGCLTDFYNNKEITSYEITVLDYKWFTDKQEREKYFKRFSGIEDPGWRYIGVKLSLTNTEQKIMKHANNDLRAYYDEEGFKTKPIDYFFTYYVDIYGGEVAPNRTTEGWVFFSVPNDTELVKVGKIFDDDPAHGGWLFTLPAE